jgi:hypothetical protein
MTKLRTIRFAAVVAAGFGLATPRCALQAAEKPAAKAVADVALSAEGDLAGVVTSNGKAPVDGALVTLSKQGQVVAKTTTNEQGEFSLVGVKGGVYELKAGPSTKLVRVWNEKSAPPSAADHATMVVNPTVRAQGGPVVDDPYYEMGGVDFLSIATLATSAGALAVGIVDLAKINDVQDDVDKLASP